MVIFRGGASAERGGRVLGLGVVTAITFSQSPSDTAFTSFARFSSNKDSAIGRLGREPVLGNHALHSDFVRDHDYKNRPGGQ